MIITGPELDYSLGHIQSRAIDKFNANPAWVNLMWYYFRESPTRNIRWSFAVAQSALETGWGHSQVFLEKKNLAGVKIPIVGGYRAYPNFRLGVIDHLDLLAVYTGLRIPDSVDPSRNERLRFFAATSGEVAERWAEDVDYDFKVSRIHNELFGSRG